MGLNMKAVVDSALRFMYMALLAGGRSSGIHAYCNLKLKHWIESFPLQYFASAENAYFCTEHILTPFCGSSHILPESEKNVY
jgi:hypothetical protein